ncbi:hypothetical protein F4604DRAFT_1937176 [Suillus subluteus]|nr:hypothetical protein F4604DRAFT_1937176 [Suillus subluteus]
MTEHIQVQDSESRFDLTLPVFTPEVKRMGGQSRVYLGDPTSTSSYPGSARQSLFLRVGAAFFAGFFEPPNGMNTLRPSPPTRFPPCFPPSPTQAGAEPGVAATAPSYPLHSDVVHLVSPMPGEAYLRGTPSNVKFGIDSGPEAPDTCNITGVHLLHRNGARYPADYSSGTGPGRFASKLNRNAEDVTATGPLSFLDDWTYKLVSTLTESSSNAQLLSGLTPFGRSQLWALGFCRIVPHRAASMPHPT